MLLGYLFLYLLRVPKIDAMGQAHVVGAGGYEPLIYPVITEVTLLGDAFLRIKGYGIIWTCVYTEFASDALLLVQNHNTVVSLEDRFLRAGLDTFGLIAVSAHIHTKNKFRFPFDDPGAFFLNGYQFDPGGGQVFLFACYLAGLAPPAGFVINNQRVCLHTFSLPLLSSGLILQRSVLTWVAPMAGSQSS